MSTQSNISRFTYAPTNFIGWRLSLTKADGTLLLARYFADKEYGSEEEARVAAEQALNTLPRLQN